MIENQTDTADHVGCIGARRIPRLGGNAARAHQRRDGLSPIPPLHSESTRRDGALAAKLVENLFAVRNAVDPAEAYRAFRGRDARIDALMRDRGFPVPVK